MTTAPADPPTLVVSGDPEAIWHAIGRLPVPTALSPGRWDVALARAQLDGLTTAGAVRAIVDGAEVLGGLWVAITDPVAPDLRRQLAMAATRSSSLRVLGPGHLIDADPNDSASPRDDSKNDSPNGIWHKQDGIDDSISAPTRWRARVEAALAADRVDAAWDVVERLQRHLTDVGRVHEADRLVDRLLAAALTPRHRARALTGRASFDLLFDRPGDPLATLAEAAARVTGPDRGPVCVAQGTVHLDRGAIGAALAAMDEGVALLEPAAATHAEELAEAVETRAIARQMAGRAVAARADAERAVTLLTALHGEAHPAVARALHGRALVLYDQPDAEAARRALAAARATAQRVFGTADHPRAAELLDLQALTALGLGDRAAVELAIAALDARARQRGADHPDMAIPHQTAALVAVAAGDAEAAQTHARRCVQLRAGDGAGMVEARVLLARVCAAVGDRAGADTALDEARRAALGVGDPDLIALVMTTRLELADG